jgi:putative ABC transport system permease protein
MGLLGMSLLTTYRRTREIGIRKVNGAMTRDILILLSWDFLKWILLSYVLAVPLAYYAMNRWMENFAYRTGLSWWIFALAGLISLLIAWITVSVQSWRASTRNPADTLRYE